MREAIVLFKHNGKLVWVWEDANMTIPTTKSMRVVLGVAGSLMTDEQVDDFVTTSIEEYYDELLS